MQSLIGHAILCHPLARQIDALKFRGIVFDVLQMIENLQRIAQGIAVEQSARLFIVKGEQEASHRSGGIHAVIIDEGIPCVIAMIVGIFGKSNEQIGGVAQGNIMALQMCFEGGAKWRRVWGVTGETIMQLAQAFFLVGWREGGTVGDVIAGARPLIIQMDSFSQIARNEQ